MKKIITTGLVSAGLLLSASIAQANEYADAITDYYNSNIKSWLSDPAVINAIKAQNTAHTGMDAATIDKLDKQWRAEAKAGSGPLIDKVSGNALSSFLAGKKGESNGIIAEMFVMDNLGLNVGVSDITSDYWQGDEGKFQNSFGKGASGVDIGELEFDDSSESFSSQYSVTITDGGTPIGAITIGVNVENL